MQMQSLLTNRRERNQMHTVCTAVHFQCIANAALGKIHTTKLTAYILDISTKSRYLDKPERSVAGHLWVLHCHSSARRRENRLEKRSIFISWLFDKKKNQSAGSFQYFTENERTSSTDSARSAVCNAPQSKSREALN